MMTTTAPLSSPLPSGQASLELAQSWRRLTRVATIVALMTAPALIVWFTQQSGWSFWKALVVSLAIVIVFRGMADLLFRRIIPWPSLFGVDSEVLREDDIVGRRRAWFWRFWLRLFVGFAALITILWIPSRDERSWAETVPWFFDKLG